MELTLMVALMLHGRATLEEIGALLPLPSRRVVMHKIRAKFHQIGAADPLQTVPNWGLMLRVEADSMGTKSTWVGIDENSEATSAAVSMPMPSLTKEGLEDAGLLMPPHGAFPTLRPDRAADPARRAGSASTVFKSVDSSSRKRSKHTKSSKR
jgi:hypothetical protein